MASEAPAMTDGPVMTLINKRIRNHRKKLNRIANMEESLSQGKTLNNEQLEVLRSKPAIVAQIEELEKLKAPLASALTEELTVAVAAATAVVEKKEDDEEKKDEEEEEENWVVEDMLRVIYFGMLFDVKSQGDFNSVMLTRSHERGCCLTYDCVTDDDVSAADLLGEKDLDVISMLGGMLVSRPVDSSLSHKNAIERCVEHAKLWLAKADQPIDPNNAGITYASLRDRLNKIMSSEYFTTTPEMKAPEEVAAAAAAAAGSYAAFQAPAQEVVVKEDQPKEDDSEDAQGNESGDNQLSPEETNRDEVEAGDLEEAVPEGPEQEVKPPAEEEHDEGERNQESQEQQHVPRRPYQNRRGRWGGRRGGFYYGRGRGGGRRGGGYQGYQNGRHQYYDQYEYYPRNYHRGRGGTWVGHYYNRHARTVAS